MRGRSWLDTMLLCTLAVLTWEKIRWETPAVTLTATNLFALAFVILFLIDRVRRLDSGIPPACLTLIGFMGVFGAVFLAGYLDLANKEALSFWAKGLGSWTVHFAFLICGVAHLARRGRHLFVEGWKWFTYGILLNCAYGLLQLLLQVGAGINLDKLVVGPLTAGQGGVGGINTYGVVSGSQSIYRINALTGDPNHLGVMLCVPLLVFLPLYLREPRERRRMGWMLLFMLCIQILTLSRSGALGDIVGLIVLFPVIRHRLPSLRSTLIVVTPIVVAFGILYASSHFIRTVLATRLSTGGSGTQTHLQFYQLVPPALDPQSAVRDGLQHVRGVLRDHHRPHRLRAALHLDRDARRDGHRGPRRLHRLLPLPGGMRLGDPAGHRPRHPRHGLGLHRGADRHRSGQLLLPHDVVRLLLRAGAPHRGRDGAVRPGAGAGSVARGHRRGGRRAPHVIG